MKNIFKSIILSLGIFSLTLAPTVGAVDVIGDVCSQNADAAVCKSNKEDKAVDMTKKVINTLLFVLGIVAVLMIIIGGFRYTTANGDPSKVKAGKDTIMYAVIGLVVAILAYSIVNFVLKNLS